MTANISLEMNSRVAAAVPGEILDTIRRTLVGIANLNCQEINPRLPEEFQVLQVKAGWRDRVWRPWTIDRIGGHEFETWWPELFWIKVGIPDVVTQGWRHNFASYQEFHHTSDGGQLRFLPVVTIAHHYVWWTEFFDDLTDGGHDSHEYCPTGGRGGWVDSLTFPEVLVDLAKRRIAEADRYILEAYKEAENEMGFSSYTLGELIEVLQDPALERA